MTQQQRVIKPDNTRSLPLAIPVDIDGLESISMSYNLATTTTAYTLFHPSHAEINQRPIVPFTGLTKDHVMMAGMVLYRQSHLAIQSSFINSITPWDGNCSRFFFEGNLVTDAISC